MKIGAIAESFNKPFQEAIGSIAALELDGVQMYADTETVYAKMTAKEIKEVKKVIDGAGIKVSALCGDFGCDMYYTRDRAQIDKEKRIMEIAKELGTDIVTTHIGVVPDDFHCKQYESMHEVCRELAEFADTMGGHFAVETGPEKAELLKKFLDNLGGVAVNLDPANLVMCAGDDPVKAVYTLKDYIVHTHAKDGKQLKKVDTRTLYCPQYYGLEQGDWGSIIEMPLGQGNVDWDNYLKALHEIGYDGYLTIERECGENPAADIALAANFLRDKLRK